VPGSGYRWRDEKETQFHTIDCWDRLAETTAAPSVSTSAPDRLPLKRPRDFGVVIRYLGTPEQLVRLSEHYAVDEEATARLRRR